MSEPPRGQAPRHSACSAGRIAHELREATDKIDSEGNLGVGSNSQAQFDAECHVVPGYYPDDKQHYIGVDLSDEKWTNSASLSVQYELVNHGLLTNSFYTGEFSGYGDDATHLEHDYIFHVVSLGWLPDREGPHYD